MSSLTNIRNGQSSLVHLGDPVLVRNDNGFSHFLRRMSTPVYVVSSYAYCLFTSMFPPNQGDHDGVNTTTSSSGVWRDVERGRTEGQAEANNELQPSMADFLLLLVAAIIRNQTLTNQESRVGEGEIHAQYTEPEVNIIIANQTLDEESRNDEAILTGNGELELQSNTEGPTMQEAASRRGPARDVSGEHVSNSEFIGIQVLGISIIPIVIGVTSCLIQVVMEDQRVGSNQKFLLDLSFGVSLATIFLGLILFMFSIMPWKSRRRVLIIEFLVIVAFGSAFVDVCLLITFGFVVTQSNSH